MRILHLVSCTIGGGETFFRNFLTRCNDYTLLELFNYNPRIDADYPQKYVSFNKIKSPFVFITAFLKYLLFLHRHKPPVVHAHDAHSLIFALFASYVPFIVPPSIRYYYTKHNIKGRKYLLFDAIQQQYFNKCSAVFCITDAVRQSLMKYHPGKFSVICNGIDLPAASQFPPIKKSILFFGRLVKDKGVDLLISAYARSSFKNTHTLVVFGPPGEKGIMDLMKKNNVQYLGYVDETQKRNLLLSAEIVVLPSRVEGFGYAALEALNFRQKPRTLIVSDIPPYKEILGDYPTYFKCGDANDLYSKLDHVLTNVGTLENINPRRQIEKFSGRAMVDSYIRNYFKQDQP